MLNLPRLRWPMPLLAAALLFASRPSIAPAQIIQGSVLDRETGTPIVTAYVALLALSDSVLAGVLTDGSGRFVHRLKAPGEYRLRVDRIGYRSDVSDVVAVSDGESVFIQLSVVTQAIRLPEIRVEGAPRCRMPKQEGELLSDLWEEVRKGLAFVLATEQTEGMYVHAREHESTLDIVNLKVQSRRVRTWGGYTQNPYLAHPAEDLALHGYVRDEGDGYRYFGLSSETVLSRSFEDTHCFRVVPPGKGQSKSDIGLAFEPVPDRTVPDVEGVLWVDRGTAELRWIEYHFTRHLHPMAIPKELFGGETEFTQTENGQWVVNRWFLRMPQVERVVSSDRLLRGTTAPGEYLTDSEAKWELRRIGMRVREVGGDLLGIEVAGGGMSGSGALKGVVFDSISGSTLRDAVVFVRGTRHQTKSDSSGAYLLDGLPSGQWPVSFYHSWLDDLGVSPGVVVAELSTGDTLTLNLVTPSARSVLRERCRSDGEMLFGFVRSARDNRPLPGVRVFAQWVQRWRVHGDERGAEFIPEQVEIGGVSDLAGAYVLCGIPAGAEVKLRAIGGEDEAEQRAEVTVHEGVGGRVDFALPESSHLDAARDGRSSPEKRKWYSNACGSEPLGGADQTAAVGASGRGPSDNNRCPASFAALTTQNTARVASRVGHLER